VSSITSPRIPAGLLRRLTERVLVRATWLLVAAGCAWWVAKDAPKAAVAVAAAVGLAATLRMRAFGFLLGAALVVELNGVPGVDANPANIAISRTQDLMVVATLAGSAYVVGSGRVAKHSSLQRSLYASCGALALWWLWTWFRTGLFDGVPPSLAGKFARDFLYFALGLPVLADVFVTYPRLLRQLLWTAGVAAAVFAGAQIVQSQAHMSLNFILHSRLTTVAEGTTRVYSSMTMLVRAAFALSLGALIAGSTPKVRRRAAVPTALFGLSVLLQLTRAAYLGLAVGLVVAGFVWWFRRDRAVRSTVRAQLIVAPVVLVLILAAGAAVSAGERHVISVVATRAVAGYSEVNSTTGTFQTRVNDTNALLAALGGNWPMGLGFLHPAARSFPSLPGGSIRNSDLGVLNAVMLMGVVGAVLVYLPVLLVLRALLRPPPEDMAAERGEWIRLGTTIWIIGVIASSLTLGELYSFGGLQISAFMLAIATSVCVPRQPATAPSE
jgi:hypothetical protein